MFKRSILAAVLAIATSTAAHAATLTAVFNTNSLLTSASGTPENPNSVARVTVTDLAAGGVELRVVATGASNGVGSIYIRDLFASQFEPFLDVFDASSSNAYPRQIGGPGVVFTLGPNSIYRGASFTYNNAPSASLTTADFLGKNIGMITTTASEPDTLAWLFKGQFVSDITAVPLPAGLPLLMVGLGAIGLAGRKSRMKA